jgi:hypothetical protein
MAAPIAPIPITPIVVMILSFRELLSIRRYLLVEVIRTRNTAVIQSLCHHQVKIHGRWTENLFYGRVVKASG